MVKQNTKPTQLNNPYKFSVYRNAAFTVSGDAVFDTVVFDTNSNYSTSTGKYTIPVSGYYQINARVSTGATSQRVFISLFKGSAVSVARGLDSQSSLVSSSNLSYFGYFTAAETVYINMFGAGAGETGADKAYFNGFLVSV